MKHHSAKSSDDRLDRFGWQPGEVAFELDKHSDWPVFSPVCTYCRHLTDSVPSRRQARCAAFPEGIPEEIWLRRNKHREPYPGDHGIRFEPDPRVKPEVLRRQGLMEPAKRGRRRRSERPDREA